MRYLFPLLLALSMTAGCDAVRQAIHDATSDGGGGSSDGGGDGGGGGGGGGTTSNGGGGGGGGGGPVAVGSKPAQNSGGASGFFRKVAGGGGPDPGVTLAQCGSLSDGGPVNGPDCVTAEIKCGETVVGHTRGGVNLYNTRFYEKNTCWPGTRNHNGGDERVYMFVADKSPRFQAGEERQRVTAYFDSPCADLTFTKMAGNLNKCPTGTARFCDSANPFNREAGTRNIVNMTVDKGEVYYFLVEGGDDAEGAFSISLECGT